MTGIPAAQCLSDCEKRSRTVESDGPLFNEWTGYVGNTFVYIAQNVAGYCHQHCLADHRIGPHERSLLSLSPGGKAIESKLKTLANE